MISIQSNILVVDDEQFFRKLYSDLLREDGYRIHSCSGGEAALELIRRERFDLVLTDMVMPDVSGLDVLRAARSLPDPPDVILVTGHASLESAIDALKSGARDYLIKPFNPDELKHLVFNCLEQRRLLTENDHLRHQIRLYQAGQSLSTLIDLERLLPQSLDALLRESGAAAGCAFTIKDGLNPILVETRKLAAETAEQFIGLLLPVMEVADGLRQPPGRTAQGLMRLQQSRERVWLLPLGDGDILKGGIILCDVPESFAQEKAFADLRYLAEQIGLGFSNACRYQDAQELMYTDDLTGLYNHRYMHVALKQEIRRSQRYGLKFSLLFLDLDRFKEINDRHGHLAGSAALGEVGRLLKDCVRDVDTLFRYGGDEFAAILVETDEQTARIVAERIRHVIEHHPFVADQDTPSYVTVTSGFATFPTDAVEKEPLIDLADRAMYAGKKRRNVTCGVADIDTCG